MLNDVNKKLLILGDGILAKAKYDFTHKVSKSECVITIFKKKNLLNKKLSYLIYNGS